MHSKPALFVCDGCRVGGYWLQPFEVYPGELVRIELPNRHEFPHDEFLAKLSASGHQTRVHAAGRVMPIDWIRTRRGLREVFHHQQAIEWFCDRTGLSRAQAIPWLQRVNLEPEAAIAEFAGTPRRLLAIQAALALGIEVMLFDTEGLDPSGIERALTAISQQIGPSCAICLTWFEEDFYRNISFAAVHTVTEHAPQASTS